MVPHEKKTQLMFAYLLNKAVQVTSNCRFSAKKLPLPPGRCRKDFLLNVNEQWLVRNFTNVIFLFIDIEIEAMFIM